MSEKEAPPRRYPRKQLKKGILVAWQGAGGRHTDRAKTLGMEDSTLKRARRPLRERIFDCSSTRQKAKCAHGRSFATLSQGAEWAWNS